MFARRCLTQTVCLLALVAAAGCSGGQFATVSGTITHNGVPVDGARVEFHGTTETEGGKKDIFVTSTDSSGNYVIAGVAKNPGIPPGMYKVVVTKYNVPGGVVQPQEGIDVGQIEAMISDSGGKGAGKGIPVNLLPKEYSTVGTTKLSVTLEQGKNEGKDFNLTGK
jgi:hypothetical protein